jgi:hypothetical protein
MMPTSTLSFAGISHEQLKHHLFPGDGLEAAALLLCTRTPGPRLRLLVREVLPVPYAACSLRERDRITWPGEFIESAIDCATTDALTIVPIHSHPGGVLAFSAADDKSDQQVVSSLFNACGDLHATAIMTADGAIRARTYQPDLRSQPVELVTVAGHNLSYWWNENRDSCPSTIRPMAFTSAMTHEMGRLTAVVIGVSGTGSIVAEQLARLGFGTVWLIDFDLIKHRNLNRILNATLKDANCGRLKVDMLAEAIASHRGQRVGRQVAKPIMTREAVLAASQVDVLFSCVDTLEARQIADLIASAFLIPMIDVGVSISTRTTISGAAVADVCGRIDYVEPGRSTLSDRGVYTPESLRAEYLRRVAPDSHEQEIRAGYIKGLAEEAPGVITLNMRAAAACVNEFVARAYPYRLEPNERFARQTFSLAACEEEYTAEADFIAAPSPVLARGAQEPLLGLPALREKRMAA